MHVCMKGDEQQKRGYVLTVKKPCKAVQKGNRTKHFFSSQGTASNPMMYY